MLLTDRGAVPVFFTLAESTAELPTSTSPNAGNVLTAIPGDTPVPDSAIEVGLPSVLCVRTSYKALCPSELGVNITRT